MKYNVPEKKTYTLQITTIQGYRRCGMGAMICILRKPNATDPDRFHSDSLIYHYVNLHSKIGFISERISAKRHG